MNTINDLIHHEHNDLYKTSTCFMKKNLVLTLK